MGLLLPPDQPVIWRGPMMHTAMRQFLGDGLGRARLPRRRPAPGDGRRLADHGAGVPLAGAIVVTTPQDVSPLRRAQGRRHVPAAAGSRARRDREHVHLRLPPLRHATDDLRPRRGRAMAADLRIPFLGAIPIDTRARSGGDEGKPIVARSRPRRRRREAFARGRRPGGGAGLGPGRARAAGGPDGLRTPVAPRREQQPSRRCPIMSAWTPLPSSPS